MTDTGFEPKPKSLDSSVSEFARERSDYYSREFSKIQGKSSFACPGTGRRHFLDRSGDRFAAPGDFSAYF